MNQSRSNAPNGGTKLLALVSRGGLDAKATEGINEYQKTWPGQILVVSDRASDRTNCAKSVISSDIPRTLRTLEPDAILALHVPANEELLTSGPPVVFVAEFDRRIRTDIHLLAEHSPFDRARITVGQIRIDRAYRRMARRSAGLQCNGPASWDAYARFNESPIFFHDHRIREEDLAMARNRKVWRGDHPPRVAFSGRVINIKGAPAFIEVARRLRDKQFLVVGDGELRPGLEALAPANVTFVGTLPFSEWKPFFRENVDVALLPHPQGDPSCTHFEAIGSGVPVVGLANPTWVNLVRRQHLGWAERNISGLVDRLRSIQPVALDAARKRGLAYIRPFEEVAKQRIEHILSCVRSVQYQG